MFSGLAVACPERKLVGLVPEEGGGVSLQPSLHLALEPWGGATKELRPFWPAGSTDCRP